MITEYLGFEIEENANIDDLLKKISNIKNKCGYLALTIVDANVIAGEKHIEAAVWHAYNKFQNNNMISATLDTEIILFITGKRQIKKAIKAVGLTEKSKKAILICVTEKKQDDFEKTCEIELFIKANNNIIELTKEKEKIILERIFDNNQDLFDFKNLLSIIAKLDQEK